MTFRPSLALWCCLVVSRSAQAVQTSRLQVQVGFDTSGFLDQDLNEEAQDSHGWTTHVTFFVDLNNTTQIPQSLRKADGYDHRDAMFGIPPYGGSIQQQVYYTDSTLCDGNVDKTAGYPERTDKSPWKTPFILMVDRGDCSFVQKVRNAQRAGATGVLIADDMCLCDRSDCQVQQGEFCES